MAQLARLGTIAQQINEEHRKVEAAKAKVVAAVGNALQHARRAGKLLVEAKERTPYGEWLQWLKENFEGSEKTAQNYMRVHSRWPEIEQNAKSVADLTLTEALKAIAPPPATATTQDQATAITRERVEGPPTRKRVEGPPRWAGVEAGEEPTEEDREQLKGERSEEDGYDYAQAMIAQVKPGGDDIVEVLRAINPEYLVRRGDGNTLRYTQKALVKAGWRRCTCCDGYGITNNSP